MPLTQVDGLPREDPRLSFTAPLVGTGGWILIDDLHNLHVADTVDGNVRYRRSDFELPPWATVTMVTSGGQDSEPRFTIWKNRRIVLFLTRARVGGQDVYWTVSQSDGRTFKTESLFVADAKHPTCNTGRDDELFAAYYLSGQIMGRWRDKGDAALSTPFAFVDKSGAALAVEDDCFHMSPARRKSRQWELFVRILGDTSASLWRSNSYPPTSWVRKS